MYSKCTYDYLEKLTNYYFYDCDSDKCSGFGILEFSTNKAGHDVSSMNMEFSESKQGRTTFDSIAGKF